MQLRRKIPIRATMLTIKKKQKKKQSTIALGKSKNRSCSNSCRLLPWWMTFFKKSPTLSAIFSQEIGHNCPQSSVSVPCKINGDYLKTCDSDVLSTFLNLEIPYRTQSTKVL